MFTLLLGEVAKHVEP